jgi:hypothetical protein
MNGAGFDQLTVDNACTRFSFFKQMLYILFLLLFLTLPFWIIPPAASYASNLAGS